MTIKLVTEGTLEPVTLDEARLHLRVDFTDDDEYIAGLIRVARQKVEHQARRALINQTWRWTLPQWPTGDTLVFPKSPLSSVTSITYYDTADTAATFASTNYLLDTDAEPGLLVLNDTAEWPSTTLRAGKPIQIVFVAGFGDNVAKVPDIYKQAILLTVGHFYENREAVISGQGLVVKPLPMAVDHLLRLDRRSWF